MNAVAAAIARLPEGTRYALWTTGDRPTKLVDFTDDRSLAAPALRRVFPQGGNRVLDAIVEAGEVLRESAEGARAAMLIVSGVGIGFTDVPRHRVVDEGLRHPVRYLVLQVLRPRHPPKGARSGRFDYEYVFNTPRQPQQGRATRRCSRRWRCRRRCPRWRPSWWRGYRVVYDALPRREEEAQAGADGGLPRRGRPLRRERVPAREQP